MFIIVILQPVRAWLKQRNQSCRRRESKIVAVDCNQYSSCCCRSLFHPSVVIGVHLRLLFMLSCPAFDLSSVWIFLGQNRHLWVGLSSSIVWKETVVEKSVAGFCPLHGVCLSIIHCAEIFHYCCRRKGEFHKTPRGLLLDQCFLSLSENQYSASATTHTELVFRHPKGFEEVLVKIVFPLSLAISTG